ncbi:hypothetical protein GYMLUDRAFT_70771 [Collybiopsis luxurians FD-317 M1]|nr:hypothetical protein GYMLUDRAFT_70771 [Collybiopsis luxurians FD-317 M1]
MVSYLSLYRLTVLVSTSIFAVIVLGLASNITAQTEEVLDAYFVFAAMAIAVSALTLLTLPAMIAIDFMRKGAFTSMVIVELGWFFILWVLWVSAAALSSQEDAFLFGVSAFCTFGDTDADAVCHQFTAIEAFSHLAWLALLGYIITLLTYAIISTSRGGRPWFSSVGEGLLPPRAAVPAVPAQQYVPAQQFVPTGNTYSSATPSTGYPPQQQYGQPQYGQQPTQAPTMAQV